MDSTGHDSSDDGGRHPTDGSPPSLAIARSVAEALDCSPLDLPPLANSGIDPDSLDALFDSPGSEALDVRFRYAGHHVTVLNWCVYVRPC